jgi:hypothetical protein
MIDYISTHKNETAYPQVTLFSKPADWEAHQGDEAVRKTYYVQVDKDGHATGVFENDECTVEIEDAYCAGILKDMLFLPALKDGNPVDGVTHVRLASLAH